MSLKNIVAAPVNGQTRLHFPQRDQGIGKARFFQMSTVISLVAWNMDIRTCKLIRTGERSSGYISILEDLLIVPVEAYHRGM
jgi:hypothetical protein